MKKIFSLGIRSTQESESLNSDFKNYLSPDVDFIQFFKKFEQVVEEKRYKELTSDFIDRDQLLRFPSLPSLMLEQVSTKYTTRMFKQFHQQYLLKEYCCVKRRIESEQCHEYVIGMVRFKGEWKVLFLNHPEEQSISRSYKKFESLGILCCHAIKVLDVNEVKTIPTQYILKRWTKEAKNGIVFDGKGKKKLLKI